MATLQHHDERPLTAGDERGFVLVIAVIVMALLLVVITAAVAWSTSASATARREAFQQQALVAAQSGMRMAVYETNSLGLDLSSYVNPSSATADLLPGQCVVAASAQVSAIGNLSLQSLTSSFSSSGALNVGGNWCSPIRANLGNGESYCYQLSPLILINVSTGTVLSSNSLNLQNVLSLKLTREVVASGTAGGVTRWVSETLQDPVSSVLSSVLGGLLGPTPSLNIQLYKPLSGTYSEGQPTTAPSGGFGCP
ncbi:MAG: hypothetical protein ACYDHH_06355 [Solirubrobacteraceae bacterium]